MARMIEQGENLKMAVDMRVKFNDDDLMAYNTVAEIPGTDLKDEIVMLGAHMDSWHSGTGATDNGAIIPYHWKTGILNAGHSERWKAWPYLFVAFATDTGQIEWTVNQATNPIATPQYSSSGIIKSNPSAFAAGIWDASTWDAAIWGGGAGTAYPIYRTKTRMPVPVTIGGFSRNSSVQGTEVQAKFGQ